MDKIVFYEDFIKYRLEHQTLEEALRVYRLWNVKKVTMVSRLPSYAENDAKVKRKLKKIQEYTRYHFIFPFLHSPIFVSNSQESTFFKWIQRQVKQPKYAYSSDSTASDENFVEANQGGKLGNIIKNNDYDVDEKEKDGHDDIYQNNLCAQSEEAEGYQANEAMKKRDSPPPYGYEQSQNVPGSNVKVPQMDNDQSRPYTPSSSEEKEFNFVDIQRNDEYDITPSSSPAPERAQQEPGALS